MIPFKKIRNYWISSLVILLGLVVVAGETGADSINPTTMEIVNSGFEQQAAGGVVPGWKQTYGVGVTAVTYGISNAAKYSGDYSLYLNDNSATAALGLESDKFPVIGGTGYSASAMFMVERGRLAIYLQFFNQSGARISNTLAAVEPAGGSWTRGSVSGIAPAEAVTASVLLYSSSADLGAGYIDDVKAEVNPIGTFDNLGQPIINFINQGSAIGKEQGKDVAYSVVMGAGGTTVFAVTDMSTAKVIKTIPMPGATGAWALKAASDGTIYIGTNSNGRLYRYTPGGAALADLGRLGQETHVFSMAAGVNGKMYMGTYPNARVYEYDPVANRVNDLGKAHPDQNYVDSLAYDPVRNALYAGMGRETARLVRIDLATGNKTELLERLLPNNYNAYDSVFNMGYGLGKLFIRLSKPDHLLIIDTATETVEYYDPAGNLGLGLKSVALMPGDTNNVYFGGNILRSYNIATRTFTDVFANAATRAFNFQDAKFVQLDDPGRPGYTLIASGEKGQIMYYNMQTGTLTASRVDNYGAPIVIQSLHTGFDGNIYIGGYLGASGFNSYRPQDGTFTDIREFGQVESVASLNNKLYIGTYGNARVYEYDPAVPWSTANPKRIAEMVKDGQDRPFAIVSAETLGKLYIGSVPDYGSHSGALTVYDVAARNTRVFKDIVHNQGVVSLVYKDGFVYGGTTIFGGLGTSGPTESEGKLFIFDTATNTKVFEISPVPGRKVVSGLLAGPDGMIWGVAEDHIFKFDPNTRQVVYKAAKLGRYGSYTVWVDAFLELGTDGNVYGTNRQKTFFMIKPETMEFVTIKSGAGNYLTQDLYGNFYMANDASLWKYTLPTDEQTIEDFLERAGQAETLSVPVRAQLTNSLRQAVHQHEKGHRDQAVAHLQNFLKHLHNKALDSSIPTAIKWPLDQQIRTLMAKWERN